MKTALLFALFSVSLLNAPGQDFGVESDQDSLRELFRALITNQNRSVVQLRVPDNNGGKTTLLGTIIDDAGGILTKSSEIETSVEVRVGFQWKAVIVEARLPSHDLALVRAPQLSKRRPIAFEEITLRPGQWLLSLGLLKTPIGIGVASLSEGASAASGWLGVQVGDDPKGAKVGKVESESPAESIGLTTGDIIVGINDEPVTSKATLLQLLRPLEAGATITVHVIRDYDRHTFSVELGWPPVETSSQSMNRSRQGLHGPLSRRRTGLPNTVRHDTVLLPSQCGGPVMDSFGRIVGINIARVSRTHSALLPSKSVKVALSILESLPKEK
jgi:S1-C subfamily serine protease